jgi:CTP synthase
MQVLELPESRHPFFVATQAHPELTSRPLNPQPFFVGLVKAALIASGVSPESVSAAKDDNPSRAGSLGQPTVSS